MHVLCRFGKEENILCDVPEINEGICPGYSRSGAVCQERNVA